MLNRNNFQLPIRTIAYLILLWLILIAISKVLRELGLFNNVPLVFPITVFEGPTIHIFGIPYLILFIVILLISIRIAINLNVIQVFIICLSLIVIGNLAQGSWQAAFISPFTSGDIQYFHDAIKINSVNTWLGSFNVDQRSLLLHTQTHPPFAVIIHYIFLKLSGGSVVILSLGFILISSFTIPLIWKILQCFKLPIENRNLICILFSVIPAINIYSAVSLDGVILASSTLFLLGSVLILNTSKINLIGLTLLIIGFTLTNFLSFGGLFLLAFSGIIVLWEIIIKRKSNFSFAILITLFCFAISIICLNWFFNYNHINAFLTAANIENPNGFRGLYEPSKYLATRIACIGELALFLSFGLLSIFFHPEKLKKSLYNLQNLENVLLYSSLFTVVAMFLTGAFRTGEMARPALFFYPYIMLSLTKTDNDLLKSLIMFAGIQTILMQIFGEYFW